MAKRFSGRLLKYQGREQFARAEIFFKVGRWNKFVPLLATVLLAVLMGFQFSANAENPEHVLWGVMDWKIDPSFPDTDTSPTRPIFRDSGAHMIAHQYQGPHWLAEKISEANKNEISRIYGAGHCINLMLYFVSCTYDEATGEFSYPLNDQFLEDYAQLIDAYKVGGGPLYIQVFPEFEIWYGDKSPAVQDAYRAKIVSQYQKMVEITRTNYSRAYIGLCFFTRDFVSNTGQFYNRWDPVLSISDVVWVNAMTPYRQWYMHAEEYIKSTRLLSTNWGLPIIFPFVELWADKNTPVFGNAPTYAEDVQNFSNCITNWIGRVFTAPAETTMGSGTNWTTNLKTLKSRNLLAFSLYSAHYSSKPASPPDPDGVSHPLESYSVLTNLMRSNARSYLYPINETEFWQNPSNAPVATANWSILPDTNCSSGSVVQLDANADGQSITFKVPVTHAGEFRVLVGIRKQSDGGRFTLHVDDNTTSQGPERDTSLNSGENVHEEFDQGLIEFSGFTRTHWADFTFSVSGPGNNAGRKLAIDYIKLEPQTPPLIPQSPTGVKVIGTANGTISLTWNKVAGAEMYHLKRATVSGGPYTIVASNLVNNTHTDTGLINGVNYFYVVSAKNSVGEGANSVEVSGTSGTIIVDNADAAGVTLTGEWTASTSSAGFHGNDYLHDGNSGSAGGKSVRFTPDLPVAGRYQVSLRWTSDANRASNVPVDVIHASGTDTFQVNQKQNGGVWLAAGVFRFNAGTSGGVVIRNDGANGYVIADAVRFIYLQPPTLTLQSELSNGVFHLSFPTQTGYTYSVESTDDLELTEWTVLETRNGNGSRMNFTEPANQTARFYRVRVQ